MRATRGTIFFTALLILTGARCGGEPSEEVGEVSEALTSDVVGPFTWDNTTYTTARTLMPTSSHFCVLSRVAGDFQGEGETIRVHADANGWWYLGDPSVQHVAGTAYCFAKSRFHGPAPTSKYISQEFYAWGRMFRTCGFLDLFCEINAGIFEQNLYWGDAASILLGVNGEFRGISGNTATRIWIDQSSDPFASSKLGVWTIVGFLKGYASSLFVGAPQSGHPARFQGPNGIGIAGESGEYQLTTTGQLFMAPTDSAMCYLTQVAGDFRSTSHSIEVTTGFNPNGQESWILRTTNGVAGRARCFLFDQ
jgi:hypothetical protein